MMFFNVPEARIHLLEKGEVYTVRPKDRRTGKETAVRSNHREKVLLGKVSVEFVKRIACSEDLVPYLEKSGFQNVYDWWEDANYSTFLYYARMLELLANEQELEATRTKLERKIFHKWTKEQERIEQERKSEREWLEKEMSARCQRTLDGGHLGTQY